MIIPDQLDAGVALSRLHPLCRILPNLTPGDTDDTLAIIKVRGPFVGISTCTEPPVHNIITLHFPVCYQINIKKRVLPWFVGAPALPVLGDVFMKNETSPICGN